MPTTLKPSSSGGFTHRQIVIILAGLMSGMFLAMLAARRGTRGQSVGIAVTKLLGTVVRNQLTAGEPVTQGSLVSPGDRGFLAAALGPGRRRHRAPLAATAARAAR